VGSADPATTPYPWPWDGQLEPSRTALLLVKSDGPGPELPDPVIVAVQRLVQLAHRAGALVVTVRTTFPPRMRTAPAPAPSFPVAGSDVVVSAAGCDGFYGSDLDAVLRRTGRDTLVLTGYWLETGVHSTLRSANDRGYECLTVADACGALCPEIAPNALSSIEMSGGIFGAVGVAEVVASALTATRQGAVPR
jgi:nicotinamidase-related amidase